LCDLILKKSLSIKDLVTHRKELLLLESVFGKAKMETLDFYTEGLASQGFVDVRTVDVSKSVNPTLRHWRDNLTQNEAKILECISTEQLSQFRSSIDVLSDFFASEILGYGLVSAMKP
jgi:cyclopropane fatty-acyl-phospholipid synthase-like methyltransferase